MLFGDWLVAVQIGWLASWVGEGGGGGSAFNLQVVKRLGLPIQCVVIKWSENTGTVTAPVSCCSATCCLNSPLCQRALGQTVKHLAPR